ncbi:MAG: AmmeMemoRadiSam system protein B [Planctomycetota bacterium]|jgi:AmmeMemoRadiSam system protein B
MSIESLPEHIRRPHLRPVQPRPVLKNGKPFVALRDPAMLVPQTLVVPAQALPVLQRFRGEQSIAEIADQLNGKLEQFVELAKRLDDIGLLWGPTFERLEAELKDKLHAQGAFPATASRAMGDSIDACRKAIDAYIEQTEPPDLAQPAVGIVAPHLDYQRGWPNYAAAYQCFKDLDPPDRAVILGTNHLGIGDGVVLSEFGFNSPMGRCPADTVVIGKLIEQLGRPLIIDQLDHLAEHSIQLHLPWLQYFFGDVPLVAALIPDPLVPMIEEDGERVTGPQLVDSLRDVLADVGGQTLYVASSDLSHVGLQFGEPRPVDEQRRIDVERHDRDMLASFLTGDPEVFLSGFQWNKNPTRWCSIGDMVAILTLTEPGAVELIDYRQAYDERGYAMVSSAAIALI